MKRWKFYGNGKRVKAFHSYDARTYVHGEPTGMFNCIAACTRVHAFLQKRKKRRKVNGSWENLGSVTRGKKNGETALECITRNIVGSVDVFFRVISSTIVRFARDSDYFLLLDICSNINALLYVYRIVDATVSNFNFIICYTYVYILLIH